MARLRTLLEWSALLIPLIVIGFLGYYFIFDSDTASQSGLPDTTGGFYQTQFFPPQQFTKTMGNWHFSLISSHSYTLAGRIVGRHEYPATLPDGIIALDLAVVNGDLVKKDILSFFSFEMGSRTLKYSYDIPKAIGLSEVYIDEHISNNHLVFRNTTLEDEVKQAPEGSCVIITGKLVDIRGTSSGKTFSINTSTVRNDGYPAGCEIILVESCTLVNCGNENGGN